MTEARGCRDATSAAVVTRPLHPDRVGKLFDNAQKTAAVPRIRLHDLRHTCAVLHLKAGVHVKVVQELLGHATIAVTMDTYSHVLPGMQEEAAERIAELLAPTRRRHAKHLPGPHNGRMSAVWPIQKF